MLMDEHAARVVEGVLVMIDRFELDAASVADLQTSAEGAAGALDNSNADLRRVFERLKLRVSSNDQNSGCLRTIKTPCVIE